MRADRPVLLRHPVPVPLGADGRRRAVAVVVPRRPDLLRDPLRAGARRRQSLRGRGRLGDPLPLARGDVPRADHGAEPRCRTGRLRRTDGDRQRLRRHRRDPPSRPAPAGGHRRPGAPGAADPLPARTVHPGDPRLQHRPGRGRPAGDDVPHPGRPERRVAHRPARPNDHSGRRGTGPAGRHRGAPQAGPAGHARRPGPLARPGAATRRRTPTPGRRVPAGADRPGRAAVHPWRTPSGCRSAGCPGR